MSFKAEQVLRTKVPLKSPEGTQVSPGTRVVVMKLLEDGKARVKVVDPNYPDLSGKIRIEAGPGAFNPTERGRPAIKATK